MILLCHSILQKNLYISLGQSCRWNYFWQWKALRNGQRMLLMEIDVYSRHDCVCHISYPSCYTTPTIHTSLFSSHHLDTSLWTHLKLLCLIYLWLVRRAKEPGHPCSALLCCDNGRQWQCPVLHVSLESCLHWPSDHRMPTCRHCITAGDNNFAFPI